jgi:lipopolysaccharide transport system permease protein
MFSSFLDIFKHRALIVTFARRNLKMRFLASALGVFWIVATPIMLLFVYTFVFGFIFQPQWDILIEKNVSYVLFLFTGLTVYWIFAEIINSAPGTIRSQAALVKKVRFPVHILPVVLNVTAVVNWTVNFSLLLIAMAILRQGVSWTILLAPLSLIPVLLFTVGLAWLLTATGTYFRDVAQAAGVLNLTGLFLSAIFFPVSALPEKYQIFFYFNPVSVSIETLRSCVLYGEIIDWQIYLTGCGVGLLMAALGLFVFQRVRGGFADVL